MRGSVARVLLSVSTAATGFLMMPFLVGHLGSSTYGVWIALSTLTGAYFLLDLGLTTAVMRYVAAALGNAEDRRVNEIVSTALALYIGLGIVVMGLSVLVAAVAPRWIEDASIEQSVRHAVLILGLNMAVSFPARSIAGVVQARLRHDLVALAGIVGLVVQTSLNVWAVLGNYGIVGLAYGILAAGLLQNVLVVFFSKRLFAPLRVAPGLVRRALLPELFSYSAWSFAVQIGEQFRSRSDPFVIGALFSAAAITTYTVGAQLAEYYLLMLLQATNFVVPVLTRYIARGRTEDLRESTLFLIRLNAALGVFGVAGLVSLGRDFITVWMGSEFAQAYWILLVLLSGCLIQFVSTPLESLLYAAGQHRKLAALVAVEGVAKVVLAILLGRSLGLVGVAFGTVIPLYITRPILLPLAARAALPALTFANAGGLVRTTAMAVLFAAGAGALIGVLSAPSYAEIFLGAALFAAVYWPLVLRLGFDAKDRARILDAVPFGIGRYLGWILRG
jgi:O-antigen/teichoic acid export membrane protein